MAVLPLWLAVIELREIRTYLHSFRIVVWQERFGWGEGLCGRFMSGSDWLVVAHQASRIWDVLTSIKSKLVSSMWEGLEDDSLTWVLGNECICFPSGFIIIFLWQSNNFWRASLKQLSSGLVSRTEPCTFAKQNSTFKHLFHGFKKNIFCWVLL